MLYIGPAAILAHDGVLEDGAVLVEGERVVALGPAGEVACPPGANGCRAKGCSYHGYVDLQINGAFAAISRRIHPPYGKSGRACLNMG